jgi:predicted DNA-binding transcriptional regulator AlpA
MNTTQSVERDRRIGIEEVVSRVNKRKSTIYARMKAGAFPQRNHDGWLDSEIDYYVKSGVWPPIASNDHQAQAA